MKKIRPLLWGFLVLVLPGCGPAPAPAWHAESGYRWRELVVPRRGRPGFTILTGSRTGISFANQLTEEQLLDNRHLMNGSGVALGDVDGDGLVDVYLARLDGSNVLYKNLGDWRFADVTARAGVAAAGRFSTGAVFADVDGDGDLDLLVTALGGPNALYLNDGTGVFVDGTRDAGLESQLGSTTMTLADVDGDGDLDLYVANYKVKTVQDLFSPAAREFDRMVQEVNGEPVLPPEFQEHYTLELRGTRLLRRERAEPDRFYLNDGTGHFAAVAFTSGRFRDANGRPLTATPVDWGLAARFYDVDLDGDPDLYVCNDFESPDRFWINDGTGRFQLAPHLALRTTSHSTMAVDFSDIDRDGDVDFFLTDMLSQDSRRRKTRMPAFSTEVPQIGVIDDRPQAGRNTLFMNRGDGTFAELAFFAGVEASDWSWGNLFLDIDLDGYEDVLISTGHVFDVLDSDAQVVMSRQERTADWRRIPLLLPPLPLRNVAFRNRGDFTFEDVSGAWGFGVEEDISHGLAAADLDGDGDLDVVVNRLGAPAAVYRNDTPAGRVAVRLRGTAPNTQGIGAKIRVLGGPGGEQLKEVTAGGMYLSGSDTQYTFATGDSTALAIEVEWRNGQRTVVEGVAPNRLYEIRETGGVPAADLDAIPVEPPLFRDVSAALGFTHTERDYNDFGRQPLLPNRLSQLGPGITWYDLDADGDDDLLITSGKGGRLAYYRNDGGRFTAVPVRMPASALDLTTVLPFPDSAGVSLLVGQMNYEAVSPAAAQEAPAVVRLEANETSYRSRTLRPMRVSPAVRGARSSTGPLALADYDQDGDLDLFVGGRVLPAQYPLAASSRLLFNDDGTFRSDGVNNRAFSAVGMVSAATFSDLDGDGDPDLVLALEWGPITIFENRGGRFLDVTAAYGVSGYLGRWNGVTTGDLDGDGLLDIVATNWGRNTSHRVDQAHPWRVYFGDFDNNGTFDIVEAQHDERLGAMSPLADLRLLGRAIPFVRSRATSFGAYADATVEELLGPALANAGTLDVTTLDHLVLLNRGDTFEAHPLPWEAQLAPAFYVGIADLDGDGNEDVFLTQNFFATAMVSQRHDAGRGLWLRGDGRGGLVAVPSQRSGIAVYGEQRGAALADYNGDGRIDLAVSQNGAAVVLYQNEQAKPGLRVRLAGPPGNPDAIGATIRLVYGDRRGPARELHAGSGYWSHDGVVQVLGLAAPPTAVWVRWPGGAETETPLAPGARAITIDIRGAALTTR